MLKAVGATVGYGRNVVVVSRLFGLLVRERRYWRCLCHRVPVRGPLSRHGGRGQVVCADAIHRATPLARHRLRDERQHKP